MRMKREYIVGLAILGVIIFIMMYKGGYLFSMVPVDAVALSSWQNVGSVGTSGQVAMQCPAQTSQGANQLDGCAFKTLYCDSSLCAMQPSDSDLVAVGQPGVLQPSESFLIVYSDSSSAIEACKASSTPHLCEGAQNYGHQIWMRQYTTHYFVPTTTTTIPSGGESQNMIIVTIVTILSGVLVFFIFRKRIFHK